MARLSFRRIHRHARVSATSRAHKAEQTTTDNWPQSRENVNQFGSAQKLLEFLSVDDSVYEMEMNLVPMRFQQRRQSPGSGTKCLQLWQCLPRNTRSKQYLAVMMPELVGATSARPTHTAAVAAVIMLNVFASVDAFKAPRSGVLEARFPAYTRSWCRQSLDVRKGRVATIAMVPITPSVEEGTLEDGLRRSAWEGKAPAIDKFNMEVVHQNPAVFRIPGLLSPDECDALIEDAVRNSEEATEYLNARVNNDVQGGDRDAGSGYSEEAANQAMQWSGGATSGMRLRLSESSLRLIDERVLALLGDAVMGRQLKMVRDQIWVRPDDQTVIVRDATVVHYKAGEGVAPHVDGKDATLLCYLNDVPVGGGGRTVFPEVNVASVPTKGNALL